VLVNRADATSTESTLRDMTAAARSVLPFPVATENLMAQMLSESAVAPRLFYGNNCNSKGQQTQKNARRNDEKKDVGQIGHCSAPELTRPPATC
jgi:hypothetical protein